MDYVTKSLPSLLILCVLCLFAVLCGVMLLVFRSESWCYNPMKPAILYSYNPIATKPTCYLNLPDLIALSITYSGS